MINIIIDYKHFLKITYIYFSSSNLKAIQKNRANKTNDLIILDISFDKQDKNTYDLLFNFKEAVCRGRKNRNVKTSSAFSQIEEDYELKKRKVINLNETRSFDIEYFSDERICLIDLFRVLFLNLIRPLWHSEQMLKFFSLESTVAMTSLSDNPDNAFGFMVESIGDAIHSMIGFSDIETYSIIDSNRQVSTINFLLPTKRGMFYIYHLYKYTL